MNGFYGDKIGKICVAGAETNNLLGNFNGYASSVYPGYVLSNLYDNNTSTLWASGNNTFSGGSGNDYVSYEFTTSQKINKYRMWPRYGSDAAKSQNPRIWELRGAVDKATYVAGGTNAYQVLDTQSLSGSLNVGGNKVGQVFQEVQVIQTHLIH